MKEELHCFFDSEKNLCFCVAEPGKHCTCKYFDLTKNGRACLYLRPDIDVGCDHIKARFEAYVKAKK